MCVCVSVCLYVCICVRAYKIVYDTLCIFIHNYKHTHTHTFVNFHHALAKIRIVLCSIGSHIDRRTGIGMREGVRRTLCVCVWMCVYIKGDHRKFKINRLTLDYVFLNKYTIKMKHTNLFLFLLI